MNHINVKRCAQGIMLGVIMTAAISCGAAEIKWAGFRSSIYGARNAENPFPAPETWTTAAQTIAANFTAETQPTLVWIVGTVDTSDAKNGKVILEMAQPAGDYPDIGFVPASEIGQKYPNHEAWLDYFDEQGIKVLLQVEPGHSDVAEIIDILMTAYGHHSSVIGFGVDVEWHQNSNGKKGGNASVSAATMLSWLNALHQQNPAFKLMVKHWAAENLAGGSLQGIPAEQRPFLIFCCDSQGSGGLQEFLEVMTTFAQAYQDGGASPDIWFQIGYPTDWWRTPAWAPENEPWFYTLKEGWQSGKNGIPAEERAELPALLGQQLASAVGANQQIGVIWVDFTMRQLYPNVF